MSLEVLEMLQKMGLHNVELQIALQCAPVLAGFKISNLLIVPVKDIAKVKQILKNTDIECELISVKAGKATMLLYRSEELCTYFQNKEIRLLMQFMGYTDFSREALFARFQKHYVAYQQEDAEFPHEMGFFLGYPLEDVVGFIQNQGKDFLHTGYWKVYANLQEKLDLFRQFDMVQEQFVQYVSEGGRLGELLRNGESTWECCISG